MTVALEDVPLPFDVPEQATASHVDKDKPIRAVATGHCPGCHLFKAIGLIPVGRHLVWRFHTYRTYSGAAVPCPASLVAVCTAPALQLPGVETEPPKCRCGA